MDLLLLIAGGFVGILFFSRIFRWLLSFVFKGAVLSIISDVLTVALGSAVYVYNSVSDGTDQQQAIGMPVLAYGTGGLVVLALDLFFDARAKAKGITR